MKKMVIWGIACSVAGVLLWGIIPPAMIPGADGNTVAWQHVAERVSYASTCTGIMIGFGLALIILGVGRMKH